MTVKAELWPIIFGYFLCNIKQAVFKSATQNLANTCSVEVKRECGWIDFFFPPLKKKEICFPVSCVHPAHLAAEQGELFCVVEELAHHIWGENPQLLLRVYKKPTSQLRFWPTSAPCCSITEEIKTESLYIYFAATHLFTLMYFSPRKKNPSDVRAITPGDMTQPQFWELHNIHFFPPLHVALR